jgi:hypothetical protein
MSIKIIGGEEIKLGGKQPPVTSLDFLDNEEPESIEDSTEEENNTNPIYFIVLVSLLLFIIYKISDLKIDLIEIQNIFSSA